MSATAIGQGPRAHTEIRFRSGFTLIEILVVVAIIALLVAILLPALSRARDQAKLSVCLSNVRALGLGCATYAAEWKGRFPGAGRYTDWLGKNNYDGSHTFGRTPIDGTIYRYAGKQNQVYLCPSDPLGKRKVYYSGVGGYESTFHSYMLYGVMGGARAEMVVGAHAPASNFDNLDHRTNMKALPGVPLLVEGHYKGYSRPEDTPSGYFETKYNSSWWVETASVANRHLRRPVTDPLTTLGSSSVAFHDGSARAINVPGVPETLINNSATLENFRYFGARYICMHTNGRKWISARAFNTNSESYGWLDHAPDASKSNVLH